MVYAITLQWPAQSILTLGAPMTTAGTSVSMLGYHGNITWKAHSGGGIDIHMPAIPPPQMPSHDAWTFKLVKLGNA